MPVRSLCQTDLGAASVGSGLIVGVESRPASLLLLCRLFVSIVGRRPFGRPRFLLVHWWVHFDRRRMITIAHPGIENDATKELVIQRLSLPLPWVLFHIFVGLHQSMWVARG